MVRVGRDVERLAGGGGDAVRWELIELDHELGGGGGDTVAEGGRRGHPPRVDGGDQRAATSMIPRYSGHHRKGPSTPKAQRVA
eukprot:5648419-Prymnesium_polylepis.1